MNQYSLIEMTIYHELFTTRNFNNFMSVVLKKNMCLQRLYYTFLSLISLSNLVVLSFLKLISQYLKKDLLNKLYQRQLFSKIYHVLYIIHMRE